MKIFKAVTSIMVLLISMNSYGQKCEVKDDPISGEKMILFTNAYRTIKFENRGTETTEFVTTFSHLGEHNTILPEGSEIIFKLKNDKILKLKSVKEAPPIAQIVGQSVMTNYSFTFNLTNEELKTLSSDKIVFMRYPSTDGGTVDLDIKGFGKIYAKKITKGANCLAESLNLN